MSATPPRPGPPCILATLLWLSLRGDISYMLFWPTGLGLVCLAAGIHGTTFLIWGWLATRVRTPLAALRAIWTAPLLFAGGLTMIATVALLLPSALGAHDPWPRLTGLAPEELIPLLTGAAVQVLVASFVLAGACLQRYFSEFVPREPAVRDPLAGPMLLALGFVLGALVLAIQELPTGKFAHLRAYLLLHLGRPQDSLQTLGDTLQNGPHGRLADSALYRMARLNQDQLRRPEYAITLLRALLERYPESPWADDALYRLGWLLTEDLDEKAREEGRRHLTSLEGKFPDSPLTGRAWLRVAESLRDSSSLDRRRRALVQAVRRGGIWRVPERYPFDLAWVGNLASSRLHDLPPEPQ